MALFITFEGGEGCGKSVQSRALYKRLSRLDIPALLTHEPGGTSLSKKIRGWLKQVENTDISPLAELLLFNASRVLLIDEVIHPELEKGRVVICDRYVDSTIAYQSYGRGLDLKMVTAINNVASRGLKPELTILLDTSAEEGLARKKGKTRRDRFEQENITFHQRVRKGYLELAAKEPERWLKIDASQPKEKVEEIFWQKVSKLLSQRGFRHE